MATVNIVRQWLPPLIFARLSSPGRFVGTLAVRSHDVLESFVRGLHATGLAVKVLVRPHSGNIRHPLPTQHAAYSFTRCKPLQAPASESPAAKDQAQTHDIRCIQHAA